MNGPREEQTAALQVTRFDHIVVNCRDVDTTAAWYERVLGMSRETFGPAGRTALTFGMQKINLRPIAATQDEWSTGVAAAAGSDDLCFITGAAPAQVRAISTHAESRSSRAR